MPQPSKLYVTFGLPGAGKSYAAKVFERFGFYVHDGDVDLPDVMRVAIANQQPIDDTMRDEFFRRITEHIRLLLPDHPRLVLAQTFIKEKYRRRFLETFPQAQFVLVIAEDPIREQRLERRTNQPLEPNYTRKMIAMFEPPHIPYATLSNSSDGDHSLEAQIRQLVNGTGNG